MAFFSEGLSALLSKMILLMFVAFGIVIGGAVLGGLSAFILKMDEPPMWKMRTLAEQLKIWGLVGALGGTFESFMKIERVFEADLSPVMEQLLYILAAFAGAHYGAEMILWLVKAK